VENTICLDKNYSTTRLITKEIPEIVASPEDKFETVLFLPEGEGRKGEGGLRTKGYFKKSFDDKPLISIVTVVYNGEKYLEETIESVINQTYDNVEYIIIDGGSTDGTRDIIKKYEDKIDYWVSERDKGIYDAMNKGILLSRGHWLNFMNAGDIFVNDNILKEINFESYENFALVYGNKIQNEKIIKPYNIKVLQYGIIMGNHQSMFFNKNILNNDLVYILEYSIYADYELVNKIYLKNYLIKYIDKNIANYEGGGISSVVSLQKRKDKYKIVLKNYGLIGVLKTILYRILKW
jgi:glycosyltransferase involved in cell wall biosynthesis